MRSGSSRASGIVREVRQLERDVAKLHGELIGNTQDKRLLGLASQILRRASRLSAKCEEVLCSADEVSGDAAKEIEQGSDGILSAIGSIASIVSLLSQVVG